MQSTYMCANQKKRETILARSTELRRSIGYREGHFKTFAIDSLSTEFRSLYKKEKPFDYVLNLSALTHVRSEKEPSTLMRMLMGNNVSIAQTLDLASQKGARKYFSVSTDKTKIVCGRLPRPPHQWCGGLGPGSAGLRSRSGLLSGGRFTGRRLRGRPSAPSDP